MLNNKPGFGFSSDAFIWKPGLGSDCNPYRDENMVDDQQQARLRVKSSAIDPIISIESPKPGFWLNQGKVASPIYSFIPPEAWFSSVSRSLAWILK
ncbi:MAG: hypothetical protein BGO78_11815 [Chloroflexi bacterium 44-23]|nr:MAG: hypothetical protein BGO78_11815 [Chloroflexi bacterium 44-23]